MDNTSTSTSTSYRLPNEGETPTYLTKDDGATYVLAADSKLATHVKVDDATGKVVAGGRRSPRSSKRGGKRSSRRGGSRASKRGGKREAKRGGKRSSRRGGSRASRR
jgi:hypothetical protein